jgi:hypothetical protein
MKHWIAVWLWVANCSMYLSMLLMQCWAHYRYWPLTLSLFCIAAIVAGINIATAAEKASKT